MIRLVALLLMAGCASVPPASTEHVPPPWPAVRASAGVHEAAPPVNRAVDGGT